MLFGGCAEIGRSDWSGARSDPAKAPRVIFQVCVPHLDSTRFVSVSSIVRGSMGGGAIAKSGTTVRGQPYFESFGDFLAETRAFTILGDHEKALHVFVPPRELSTKEWSPWYPATYASHDKNIELTILHSGKANGDAPSSDAPRMRYILMSFTQFLQRVDDRRQGGSFESVPAC